MDLTKLLRCLLALLKLTSWLRLTKKVLTAVTLLLCCCGVLGLLLQKKKAPKKLKKAIGRVIG